MPDPLRPLPMSPAQVADLVARAKAIEEDERSREAERLRGLRRATGGYSMETYRDRRNRIRMENRAAIKAGKRVGNP